jgi:RNA polymerase sigma-B factor
VFVITRVPHVSNTAPLPCGRPVADPTVEPAGREWARRLFVAMAALPADSPERRRTREQLIEMHLPLVRFFARRYAGHREPFEDVLQAGALGLVKAVDRFDPGRRIAFSTFAAPTILGEIRRHFRDRTWAVHVQRTLQELTMQVTRCAGELTQELGRAPNVGELAGRVGKPQERVLEALDCAAAYTATSLEAPNGEGRTLGETIGAEDPALVDVELHESLAPALSRLPARERRILQLRFYGNMTQSEIAAQFGISQMHVSRLLTGTLRRLREELRALD